MAGIEVDVSEVRELIADFSQVPGLLARHARPVVNHGALNIKKQLVEEWERSAHFTTSGGRPAKISYDIEDDGFSAVIGPEHSGVGNLANIAYFGGSNGGGGTVPDPRGALDAEAPKFAKALADVAAELLS